MKDVPAFRLRAEPLTDEASELRGFPYADPDVGTRHRIGGEPSFIGPDDYPSCDSCNETMTFYGQLDSIGEGFELADVGVVIVFICFDCFTSHATVRSG